MARLNRIKQFSIAQEATTGTAETLLASDVPAVLEEMGSSFTPEMNERNPYRRSLSGQKPIPGLRMAELSGKLELVAGGDATTPPACDLMLKACGLQRGDVKRLALTGVSGTFGVGERITAGVNAEGIVLQAFSSTSIAVLEIGSTPFVDTDSITGGTSAATGTVSGAPADFGFGYRPISERSDQAVPTFTAAVNDDGVRTRVRGALGTGSISVEKAGALGYLDFQLSGASEKPTDVPLITGTNELVIDPETFLAAGVEYDGDQLSISAFTLDFGNEVNNTLDANDASGIKQYRITDRNPRITIDPEATDEATIAFFGKYDSAASGVFAATIGSSVGKRVRVVAPSASYSRLDTQEREGILAYSAELALQTETSDGDDDFIIAFY